MRTSRTADVGFWLAVSVLIAPAESTVLRAAGENTDAEQALLRGVGIDTDTANLLKFLLSYPAHFDHQKLDKDVQQLGSKTFAVRERVSRALAACGQAALPALQRALKSPDKEIVRRVTDCIAAIKKRQPRPDLEQAVVRLLLRRRPAGTVAALLRYLPYATATDEELEEDIWFGLDEMAGPPGKVDPALRAALKDPLAIRRAAAACILGRRTEPELRGAVRKLLKDSDPTVRLRAAQGLLAGKEREALPTLIPLLDEPSIGLAWQAEELLHWAAGDSAPSITVGAGDAQSRRRCRKAWEQWWSQHGEKLALTTRAHDCRRPGLLLVSSWTSDDKNRHVWLCGCDGKPRWRVKIAEVAVDIALLKNNRVIMAHCYPGLIVEISLDGKVQWQCKTDVDMCHRLPDGNTLFLNREKVGEITPDGGVVNTRKFTITGGALRGSTLYVWMKLRNGRILCSPATRECTSLVECDPITGREHKTIHLQKGAAGWCAGELTGGHYLMANRDPDRVFEIDSTGKIVWQYSLPHVDWYPIRLRNHNTVLAQDQDPARLLEVDRTGKIVWETFCDDALVGRLRICLGLVRLGFHSPRPADYDLNRLIPYRRAALNSKDPLIRRGTLMLLKHYGPRAAPIIPDLIEGLLDPNPAIRKDVEEVLVKIGPSVVPALLQMLKHRCPEMRSKAADLLSKCSGSPDLILPALLVTVDNDKESSVREEALRSLGVVGRGRRETVARLIQAFKDRDRDVRRAAIQMTGLQEGAPSRDAVPHLLELLEDRDWDIRWATITSLGNLGCGDEQTAPRIVPVLIRLLNEKEEVKVRIAAANALGRVGKLAKEALPELLSAANYKPERKASAPSRVARAAAWAAEEITKDKGLGPCLADLIQEKEVTALTRRRALQAIKKLGREARAAVPALVAIIKDPAKREDWEEAASALVAIGGRPVVSELANCVQTGAKPTRCLALRTLQRIGSSAERAIPAVSTALADPDPTIKRLAWNVLPSLGSGAVYVLVPLMAKGDVTTRCLAIEALGAMGLSAREAIPALLEATKDNSVSVRSAARRVLKKVRP